ncbi:MAG TPA: hypothetical protein VJO12_03765 [Stellaceae bacterium]|nr:hypothetical protein [Stellaceae bacterium]
MVLQSLLAGLAVITVLATAAAFSAPALAKPATGPVADGTKAYARQSDCRPVIVIRRDGSRVRVMRCN